MSKNNITSCKCCKSRSQKSFKSQAKFVNCSSRNVFTQTSMDGECKLHNQQITQLLTEVAIALRQKTKVENELNQMREHIIDTKRKYNETSEKYVNEIKTLKNENYKMKSELSGIKVSSVSEQKDLLNELSSLKTQVLELNKANSKLTHDYQQEKEILSQQINSHITELDKEIKLNGNLKQKIIKYKAKFKNFISFIQSLLEENRGNKCEDPKQDALVKKNSDKIIEVGTNMEDLILRELFFKPSSIPNDIDDSFFKSETYDKPCQ